MKRLLVIAFSFLLMSVLFSVRLISNVIDDYYMTPKKVLYHYKQHNLGLPPKLEIEDWEILALQKLILDRENNTTEFKHLYTTSIINYKRYADAKIRTLRSEIYTLKKQLKKKRY